MAETEIPMKKAVNPQWIPPDQPLHDVTPYGYGKDDSISDSTATENAAITHKEITLNGKTIPYTARAGHLVTTDLYSAQPAAKIFYVSFTANGADPSKRPVTFFYNGGPGSSSVYLLLGSFGPRRIKTNGTHYTPPAPYALEDNRDNSLLDCTDLVFVNPVGTAYSTAIAPHKNIDFWGVDEDANSIKQFVKRYLTAFNRWNSPKFLFGESYGTARTCVLTWLLHEDGVDLNGIVLQSSLLDYSHMSDAVGLLPTLAADAWYHTCAWCHDKVKPRRPADLPSFMEEVKKFARTDYASAKATFPKVDRGVLKRLSEILGIPPDVLMHWKLDPAENAGKLFRTTLIGGFTLGAFDGRVTAPDTGIAASIGGKNDPAQMAVEGVYTAMWHVYLSDELKFSSTSPFLTQNDKAGGPNWNWSHIDPTGHSTPDNIYTAGDLAAAMELNPYLKVFSASGYYDAMTPFFQTIRNFENMPLGSGDARLTICNEDMPLGTGYARIKICNYESGHMIYLDDTARSKMKTDLAKFYDKATQRPRLLRIRPSTVHIRRMDRTPY